MSFSNSNYELKSIDNFSISDAIDQALFIINKILEYTDTLNVTENELSVFDTETQLIPDIIKSKSKSSLCSNCSTEKSDSQEDLYFDDLEYFIQKWTKYFDFNANMIILSIIHLDKFLEKKFILTRKNYLNVVYICMMTTHKLYDDNTYNNKDYAKILGALEEEVFNMEMEFLTKIDFNLFINENEFEKYKNKFITLFNNNN